MLRWTIGLLVLLQSGTTVPADPVSIERWDRAVCLQSPGNRPEATQVCTAFLVSLEEQVYLVTASHAAKETSGQTRLYFRATNGSSQFVSIGLLFSAGADPWKRFENSDLSVAKIQVNARSTPYVNHLRRLAVPLDQLAANATSRGTKVDVAGFPLGLGIQPDVSPLVVQGNIASTEIDTPNDWGTEPLIYMFPPLAQGTSGAPAFLTRQDPTDAQIVGMYVAVSFDASGGKLSKLVPSRVIREAIQRQHASDKEAR